VHQLEDVRLQVLSPSDLDPVGDAAVALPELIGIAGVHPEHPRLKRLLVGAVGMLDGKLRLAFRPLACSAGKAGVCLPYAA
jgi:hypothetical protein